MYRKRPLADPQPIDRRIDQTVRRARGYWRRAAVPRRERRRLADELRDHLEAATADGRAIRDVVGDDLGAFAVTWVQAGRRPLLAWCLDLGAGLTFLPAVLAVGHAVLTDGPLGIPLATAAWVGCITGGAAGVQLVRVNRGHLQDGSATRATVGILVAASIAAVNVHAAIGEDAFLAVSPLAVAALLVVSAGLQVAAVWVRRR